MCVCVWWGGVGLPLRLLFISVWTQRFSDKLNNGSSGPDQASLAGLGPALRSSMTQPGRAGPGRVPLSLLGWLGCGLQNQEKRWGSSSYRFTLHLQKLKSESLTFDLLYLLSSSLISSLPWLL